MTTIGVIEQELIDMTQDLDLEAFWEENALCQPFTSDKPRCSLSFSPDDHWVFEFMAVPSTLRYYHDQTYRNELHKQVNEITAKYVGQTFFSEDTWEHQPKRIENLFQCEFSYREGSTPWLTPATDDADEFARILDQAERTDLRTWSLPEAYLEEWERRRAEGKPLPELGTGSRGPATSMTSVIDATRFRLWLYDYPDLVARFRRAVRMDRVDRLLTMLLRPKILILDEIGYTPLERPEATFLFEVVAKRYDRAKSMIVTSNKTWGAWGEILPDQVMTAAILDRLLHRSVTVNIQGESYRLRHHRKAGLTPRPEPEGGDDQPSKVSNRNR